MPTLRRLREDLKSEVDLSNLLRAVSKYKNKKTSTFIPDTNLQKKVNFLNLHTTVSRNHIKYNLVLVTEVLILPYHLYAGLNNPTTYNPTTLQEKDIQRQILMKTH